MGVPYERQIYGEGGLDKARWGLLSAPRVESWSGWIFANLDPGAPSLDEYLDGAKWYLEFYTKKSEAGLEVMGTPQRWVISANWKLAAGNFIGDGYHTAFTHSSTVETGILPVPGP